MLEVAIIAIAHQLKIDVIAEGVEFRDHLIFLQQSLCNEGQGYFFSEPLPPDDFGDMWFEILDIPKMQGIPLGLSREKWLEDELQMARQDLRDTIRRQQGMTFKFIERNREFIHTLCGGELVYRLGFTPEKIVGNELTDFLPTPVAVTKLAHYRRAWEGDDTVVYEGQHHGLWYLSLG